MAEVIWSGFNPIFYFYTEYAWYYDFEDEEGEEYDF